MRFIICSVIATGALMAASPNSGSTAQQMTAALTSLKDVPAPGGPIIDLRTLSRESLRQLRSGTVSENHPLYQVIDGLVQSAVARYQGSL